MCALCGQTNDYAAAASRRYLGGPAARAALPELVPGAVVESAAPLRAGDDSGAELATAPAAPVVIALVDVAAAADRLELARSALLAALEGLQEDTLFGLVAFGGDEIALFEAGTGAGAAPPAVRHVPLTPAGAAPAALELEEVMPLANLLTPLRGEGKSAAAAAIEGLAPAGPGRRPLGEALQAVLRLLSSAAATPNSPSPSLAGARLVVLLSGPSNYGRGAVVAAADGGGGAAYPGAAPPVDESSGAGGNPAPFLMDPYFPEITSWSGVPPPGTAAGADPEQRVRGAGGDGWAVAVETSGALDLGAAEAELGARPGSLAPRWAATAFYGEAGAAAAALGVVVDIYAVSPTFVGLEALAPLALGSGGAVALYPSPDDAALPQDLYKRLSEPWAFGALLRVRTSPELRVAGAMGRRLRADPRFPDLFHLAACHPADAFGLELGYAQRRGLAGGGTPVLQMVFQHLEIVPGPGGGGGSQLRRRTRIFSRAFHVGATPEHVYAGVNAPGVSFALVAEAAAEAATAGLPAAQRGLLDRAVDLCTAYYETTVGPGAAVDPAFKGCEALQGLPRAVYALLRAPPLGGAAPHPDAPAAARLLWETLTPAELAVAVYPQLSSWAGPDRLAFPRHSLCRAALALSKQPIYLIDAYSELVVFYAAQGRPGGAEGGDEAPPFPPPPGSLLRQHCSALAQARRMTPRVVFVREGEGPEAERRFGRWLIEDERAGPRAAVDATFLEFLDQVRRTAEAELRK